MPMNDLYQALQMFSSGVKEFQTGRAISQAYDHVQQLKASDLNEQQQRAALQNVSNQLTAHLAANGTPATTIQALQGAIGPKQFANANDMNKEALLSGNTGLADEAAQQQAFEQNPEYKKELIKAKAATHGMDTLAGMKFKEQQDEFTTRKLMDYKNDLDSSKASSRTQFGQWAQVDGRGDRIQALLSSPDHWKNLTAPELQLVADSAVNMSKGGVPTAEESKTMVPVLGKLQAAQAQSYLTGKPVTVDLSDYAKLYSNMTQREDAMAKDKMLDVIMNKVNGSAKLAGRDPDQFKLTTASALGQLGIQVNPNTIQVDKKNGVQIPELHGIMSAADSAPKAARDAYNDLKSGSVMQATKARNFLQAYGIDPDTVSAADAAKIIKKHIRAKAFQ